MSDSRGGASERLTRSAARAEGPTIPHHETVEQDFTCKNSSDLKLPEMLFRLRPVEAVLNALNQCADSAMFTQGKGKRPFCYRFPY